jgi:hypothetical protein
VILYKYLPPRRLDVLETQLIRLTQPGDLNDPMESRLPFLKMVAGWGTFVDSVPEMRDRSNGLRPDEQRIAQHGLLQKVWDNGTVILSLSASRTVEPMWSHYADSHRGFVVGFDAEHPYFSKTNGRQLLAPVKYKKQLPYFVYFEEMRLKDLAFTKSLHWAYEREWRLVKSIAGTKRFLEAKCAKTASGYDLWLERLPAGAFHSVTIGEAAPAELGLLILATLSQPRFRHVKVYRAKFSRARRLFTREVPRTMWVDLVNFYSRIMEQIRTTHRKASPGKIRRPR